MSLPYHYQFECPSCATQINEVGEYSTGSSAWHLHSVYSNGRMDIDRDHYYKCPKCGAILDMEKLRFQQIPTDPLDKDFIWSDFESYPKSLNEEDLINLLNIGSPDRFKLLQQLWWNAFDFEQHKALLLELAEEINRREKGDVLIAEMLRNVSKFEASLSVLRKIIQDKGDTYIWNRFLVRNIERLCQKQKSGRVRINEYGSGPNAIYHPIANPRIEESDQGIIVNSSLEEAFDELELSMNPVSLKVVIDCDGEMRIGTPEQAHWQIAKMLVFDGRITPKEGLIYRWPVYFAGEILVNREDRSIIGINNRSDIYQPHPLSWIHLEVVLEELEYDFPLSLTEAIEYKDGFYW